MRRILLIVCTLFLLAGHASAQDRLQYGHPARDSRDSFLLGNGVFTAMIDGGTDDESISFPQGSLHLRQTYPCADILSYRRVLDLSSATVELDYSTSDGGLFSRSFFFSRPARALVLRLRSRSSAQMLDFSLSVDSLWVSAQVDSLSDEQFLVRGEHEGEAYRYRVHLVSTDGEYAYESGLRVWGASNAVLIITAASGADADTLADEAMRASQSKSFRRLHEEHCSAYRDQYNQVSLSLNADSQSDMMNTDERLSRYASGEEDLGLEELYYRYERYLSLSRSESPDSDRHPQVSEFTYEKYRSLLSESGFSALDHSDVRSGVTDMLAGYQDGTTVLLRNLPSAWKDGSVKGLSLPDGSKVDMSWKSGVFEQGTFLCGDKKCVLRTVRPVAVGRRDRGLPVHSHMEKKSQYYVTEVDSASGDELLLVAN